MKLNVLIAIHAFLSIAFGIAFALYGPLMMAFYAVPELSGVDAQIYWQIAAFARMFGAALFGFGFLLFALRGFVDEIEAQSRRGLVFALFLANLMAFIVSITQQSAVWSSLAGLVTTGIFTVLMIAYGYFLVKEYRTA
jgi:hypothetical protein